MTVENFGKAKSVSHLQTTEPNLDQMLNALKELRLAIANLRGVRTVNLHGHWSKREEVAPSFDKIRASVDLALDVLSSKTVQAFPENPSIFGCCHVLRRDRLRSTQWQDEIAVLGELFGSRSLVTWRLPARSRRILNRVKQTGGVEPLLLEFRPLIEKINWIEQEVQDGFGVSRKRLRKKRLKKAAASTDGLLILVRNGYERDPGVFAFSYSLMVACIQ